ncbi:MAG: saccharopine dehydrogenase [Gemmatimonadetes bacterium]|nr:saccharopine dehydrogenase NADP-binding domain-containing protein [Gemmatimonadota bacterium]MYA12161.1 saccharopine dehydrogenase [Gemmatimonadota bacterium]MYE68789.1 saccharopine dehydrogenase [Gemmatimonadota bacterium]MYJ68330.1 saccharopine dehydrogenase [Gemmatimonadota bacterium]
MRFLVLGGGAQGTAAAFDLLNDDAVAEVVIADLNTGSLHACLRPHAGARLSLAEADASDEPGVARLMEGMTGVLCALPYYFNLPMARLAVDAGVHFTDLGGNTSIVESQRGLDAQARGRGVSVLPDTGLAPGMVNVLAQSGIEALDTVEAVRLWVGGLPQRPRPPLNYQVVYSLEGMLDYYVTPATILRGGSPTSVAALSGLETLEFPDPVGRLEAFFTGGGTSTLPGRYEGRIDTLEYKTLRYPGHAHIMKAIRELGLLSDQEIVYNGAHVNPRRFFIERVTPLLTGDGTGDMVVVRVEVAGRRDGERARIRYEVLDLQDVATGLTAMARTTGFSLSLTALLQARGVVRPGVGTPDEVMPPARYIEELARRGIRTNLSESPG